MWRDGLGEDWVRFMNWESILESFGPYIYLPMVSLPDFEGGVDVPN